MTPQAEYGRTTGGVESFTTKSGTNTYHGDVYDLFRNEALEANTWYHNLQIGQNPGNAAVFAQNQRSPDRRNDYGGTLGGPVVIPKLYNGRDKTFFFILLGAVPAAGRRHIADYGTDFAAACR